LPSAVVAVLVLSTRLEFADGATLRLVDPLFTTPIVLPLGRSAFVVLRRAAAVAVDLPDAADAGGCEHYPKLPHLSTSFK